MFSNDPRKTPYGQELLKTGIEHRLFGRSLSFHYKSRLGLALFGWPRLVGAAIQSAWQSLFKSRPRPDIVALGTHFEVIIFGLARLLLPPKNRPEIVYLSFIYTSRPSPLVRQLRQLYFKMVFRLTDRIICHSSNELHLYGKLFKKAKAKFRHVPYGMHVNVEKPSRPGASAIKKTEPVYILSAGRSGRDYPTLAKAVADTGISTHIVCDRDAPLQGIEIPPEVQVLKNCYGKEYIKELENASVVVIPLLVNDISAGQMVLIQAMAYQKPIIITRTTTIHEYARHDYDCLLVELNDAPGLQQAILRLLNDSELANRLAHNARQAYEQRFNMRSYVANMVAAVQQ